MGKNFAHCTFDTKKQYITFTHIAVLANFTPRSYSNLAASGVKRDNYMQKENKNCKFCLRPIE